MQDKNGRSLFIKSILIIVISLILFIPRLGSVYLFDWDEINFAEAAREMIVTDDYLTVRIDYEPFHEKPPLFFWMQSASMHIFGVNEFAARLPNAVIGAVSLLMMFLIGRKFFDEKFGLLWMLAYAGSFLPHFYFRTGIIDPAFNLLIFLSIYFLACLYHDRIYKEDRSKSPVNLILAAAFASLAILTKGPVAYLLIFLTWFAYWFFNRRVMNFPWRDIIIFSIVAALPTIFWYAAVFVQTGSENILREFIEYQVRLLTTKDAGHGGPVYYHFVVILFGCFPASILFFGGLRRRLSDKFRQATLKEWLLLLLIIVLTVFSIVETKILHYSSLAYFPVTFVSAYYIHGVISRNFKWHKWILWIIGIAGIIVAAALIITPYLLMNVELIISTAKDEFTRKVMLSNIHWSGAEIIPGMFYLAAVIIAIVFLSRRKFIPGFSVLFGSTAVTVFAVLILLAPRISEYTQGAVIEFYEEHRNCSCYVEPLGFKTYAHYFYARRPPEASSYINGMSKGNFEKFLLEGDIDKDAYFVTKIQKAQKYIDEYDIEFLYEKNGFVFMKRSAVTNKNE